MQFFPLLAALVIGGVNGYPADAYDCWAKKKKGTADTQGRISSANSESDAVSQFKDRYPGFETYYCVKVKK